MQQYYFIGGLFLIVFWLISWMITRNPNPFAMAKGSGIKGENENFSASLLQMIVFTMLTVFAYTSVFAARALNEGGALIPGSKDWLRVPSNLLILMGISVGTAVASRAIRTQQETSEPASAVAEPSATADRSSLTTDVKGRTDLIKIQMLIWTVIAVVVYLTILSRFMLNNCFLSDPQSKLCGDVGNSLPDIDSAFMVLLGVSQGGYVVNKLSESSTKKDGVGVIAKILIEPATVDLSAEIPTKTLTATAKDAQGNAISNLPEGILEWTSDNSDVATVNAKGVVTRVAAGDCNITATANAIISNKCAAKCS